MNAKLKPPAIDPATVVATTGSNYPDDDLEGRATASGRKFFRKDGTAY